MKAPNVLEMTTQQVEEMLASVRERVAEEVYVAVAAFVATVARLCRLLETHKRIGAWLAKRLFGCRTEKTARVLAGTGQQTAAKAPRDPQRPARRDGERPRRKGHGRNGADAYPGATPVAVPHPQLSPGQSCPNCEAGQLYRLSEGKTVRIVGQPPLAATVYEQERLRCNTCGEVFTPPLPPEAGSEKYDPTARSMVAVLKYAGGMPFNRLDALQESLRVPMPAATQWEILQPAGAACRPAYEEILRQAAQAEVVYNDDTGMRLLGLEPPPPGGRTGVFSVAIVCTTEERQMAVFFTGRRHAGERLAELLLQRPADQGPPIQMSDGSSRNRPGDHPTLIANCNAHGRRKFVDLVGSFPDECRYVLETLREVYRVDAFAKQQELTAADRLRLHQEQSGPRMEGLEQWLNAQLSERRVEPNSGLGQAIRYLLKRWPALTLFLRVPGAPLDNNICERAVKLVIRHRRNSLFYKTPRGAAVGDLFMTLIHTCRLNRTDPFAYLTALQKNAACVRARAPDWMPWNYTTALAAARPG